MSNVRKINESFSRYFNQLDYDLYSMSEEELLSKLDKLYNLRRYNIFSSEEAVIDRNIDKEIEAIEKRLMDLGYDLVISGDGSKDNPIDGKWVKT